MPWWREHIVDPAGGYFEGVDAQGAVIRDERRTTLTQARLLYVFSHAHLLTGDPSMLDAARHGRAFLEARCRDPVNGGWFRAIARGAVIDPVHDAYDHAFVLFALAWHFRATGDAACRTLARDTATFLAQSLGDSLHGGFREECGTGPQPRARHRRQNPHMHLLEAWLAWHAVDSDGPWLDHAHAIVDLFETRFVDRRTGTLIEYFNDDWTPAAGAVGQWREPGHHFEWIWLLHGYHAVAGRAAPMHLAEELWRFAVAHGVERDVAPRSLAFDGVDADGNLVAATKLLMPHTELLKACAARVEALGDEPARALGAAVYAQMRSQYFDAQGVRYLNQLTRDGQPSQDTGPARILYHVFMALSEWDRVAAGAARV
jgi:mannose/cellobiose epimerase-like protein (N-acyl-D-glucosamine 2-epimerase family)